MPRNKSKKIFTAAVSLLFALCVAYFAVLPPTSAWFYVELADENKTYIFGTLDLDYDEPPEYFSLQEIDLPAATKLEDPAEVTAFDEALYIETISGVNDGTLPVRVYCTVTGDRGTPDLSLRYFFFTESDYDQAAADVTPGDNTSVMDIIRSRKNKFTGQDANIITNGSAAATYNKLEAFNTGDGVTGVSDEGNYVVIPPKTTQNIYIAFWADYNVVGAALENTNNVTVHKTYSGIQIRLSAGQDSDGWFYDGIVHP